MWLCGRLVCTITLGFLGSETSTAVKFFGALSCASQRMRRPSLATCTAMPSPMPPKPASVSWAMSLKFQVTLEGPARCGAGVLVAVFVAVLGAALGVRFGAAFFAAFGLPADLRAAFFAL